MKTPFASRLSLRFLLGVALVFSPAVRSIRADEDVQLSPQQVDQLLGPIALYPDALVALILPASTFPADIVLAQRFLSSGGDADQIDNQPWNESVRALARYPQLVQWLDENLTWTRQLGGAFLSQPDSVMESIQRLRAVAKANGTLTTTTQQKLVLDGDTIEIVPAQPDVIYVPYYDPSLVYTQRVYYGAPPFVTFGLGFSMGYWLSYDLNWHNRVIIVGDRHHNWHENRDWSRGPGPGGRPNYGNNWRPWTPPPGRPPYSRPDSHRPPPGVIQPRPMPRPPSGPSHGQHPDRDHSRPGNPPRPADQNRPPAPGPNPTWNPDNHGQRPTENPGPRPQPRVAPDNLPRPSGPPHPPPNGPRPDMGNQPAPRPTPSANPGGPAPMPNHPPSGRPPEPRPNFQPPPRPVNPPPPPPPPPQPPKDRTRDDKPEVQR